MKWKLPLTNHYKRLHLLSNKQIGLQITRIAMPKHGYEEFF